MKYEKPISSLTLVVQILCLSVFVLFLPLDALGQSASGKRVFRGQEVVVSFSNMRGGYSTRAANKVKNLRAGSKYRLTESLSDDRIGVYSSPKSFRAPKGEAIDATDADIADICNAIKAANPETTFTCEANTIIETQRTPNDSQYSSLYGMAKVSAPLAWDITTGSADVIVAVIDTGIDYNHPDLSDNIATNAGEIPGNGIDDDGNSYIDDYYGYDFVNGDSNPIDDHFHGTHCAGTIGAKGDNAIGVVGVNWTVKLLPVKVLSTTGSGTLSGVAAGMNYAVKRGAKILSLSLGTTSYSATLENAIINAKNNGVLVVAAAGNNGQDADVYPLYPAASQQENVISVASSNASDALSYFSNWGANSVDLAAPGESILSTYLDGLYAYASGTSMATPHVTGMAALLLAINPSLNYSQIKAILLSTVDPVSSMAGKSVSGGRANLYQAALQAQESLIVPTPTPIATPTSTPTPIVTQAPIATSAPEPTATATPMPTAPGLEPPDEDVPNSVSIRAERTRRSVYVFGDVVDSFDSPQERVLVSLHCGGRITGTRRTDSDGYYEFSFRRPSKPVRCFVEDDTGARSRRITVR